jgi:signal transduction histidine kinase/CheY-like chemotaxis protein
MEQRELQTVNSNKLAALIADGEDWLMKRVLAYAKEHAYYRYTSTLEEAWRLSIAGLSETLLQALRKNPQPNEPGPDDNPGDDSSTAFGILEAQRHRSRGITIAMFLGLLKYYRQSYLDLVAGSNFLCGEQDYAYRYINCFFDRIEIAFVSEWAGAQPDQITSELQSTNRHLTNEKNKYLTMFESIPNPALLVNADHRVDNLNYLAAELFTGSGKPGVSYYDEIKRDMELPWLTNELALFASGKEAEWRFEKELAGYTFEVRFKRMLDYSEKHRGTVVILNDVTERNRVKEELVLAKELAEAGNRAKGDFIATVGHEIRTPMNQIVGLTQLVLGTDLNAKQREYLETIDRSADTLSRLLTDMLDYSSVGAGRVNLAFVNFGLRDTIDQALRSLAEKAYSKDLELLCDVAATTPDTLIGDPGRLSQVIVNLVDNAIKFTDSGEVLLRVHPEWVGDHDICVRFAIKDTGKGIAAHKRGTVFDAFATGDHPKTRQRTGNGLGLAISAKLVDLMGGRIWVESEENVGSTFCFAARFGLIRSSEPCGAIEGLAGKEVLVVDDNATNRKIVAELLSQQKMRATTVDGAASGLKALVRAQQNGDRYDLVLIDAKMPEVDGFSLVAQIKAQPPFSHLPIIMMTTERRPEEEICDSGLGITAFLAKPIRQTLFWKTIRHAIGLHVTTTIPNGASPHCLDIGRSLRALVLEHKVTNQKSMAASIEGAGHSYCFVGNGSQALQAIDHEVFDLLFIGLGLPECNEFELVDAIRKKERGTGRHIQIVAVTGHAVREERDRCLESGFDDYLTKPMRVEDIKGVIERMLKSLPLRTLSEQVELDPNCERLAVVDLTKARESLSNDQVLLGEVVSLFISTSQSTMIELAAALRQADYSTFTRLAGQLKRALANLGAREAASVAAELETFGQQHELSAAQEHLPVMEEMMVQVRAALRHELKP